MCNLLMFHPFTFISNISSVHHISNVTEQHQEHEYSSLIK